MSMFYATYGKAIQLHFKENPELPVYVSQVTEEPILSISLLATSLLTFSAWETTC